MTPRNNTFCYSATTFSSFVDCSSNVLKNYDERICAKLTKNTCPAFANSTSNSSVSPDVLDVSSKEVKASCVNFGQCVVLNQHGHLYQSSTSQAMRYTLYINESQFPLYVFVKRPAETGFFIMKSYFNIQNVDPFGDYHFTFKKTTILRLPYPYTKPSCIVEGSAKADQRNMFYGKYSLGKCLDTCWYKGFLPLCGSMPIAYRSVVRDKRFLRSHYRDRSISVIEQCKDEKKVELDAFYQRCIKECQTRCNEVDYELMNKRYEPNESVASRVRLFFYFYSQNECLSRHVVTNWTCATCAA